MRIDWRLSYVIHIEPHAIILRDPFTQYWPADWELLVQDSVGTYPEGHGAGLGQQSGEGPDGWEIPWGYGDSLVQDCSTSIANALELLQSCTKPSILLHHSQFSSKKYSVKTQFHLICTTILVPRVALAIFSIMPITKHLIMNNLTHCGLLTGYYGLFVAWWHQATTGYNL